MMKRILRPMVWLCSLLFCLPTLSQTPPLSGVAYLNRFMQYLEWSNNLPQQPDSKFLNFIHQDTPLASKLRQRWLYQLAQRKDWTQFRQDYQPTADLNLQCFYQFARYQAGEVKQAMLAAKAIWLSPASQPPGCNALFALLQHSNQYTSSLIAQRFALALNENNLGLAGYLLQQYPSSKKADYQLLMKIHQHPSQITLIGPGPLHSEIYLYGLKRLAQYSMDKSIQYWRSAQTQRMLTTQQKQAFLSHLSLYKAMRDHPDTHYWFAQIHPPYYTELVLDWQIRHALRHQQWKEVESLIHHYPDPENPCWQYWLARAYEAQHQSDKAHTIYQNLAKKRNYYGFLASVRLKQTPHFESEKHQEGITRLKPYQTIMQQIANLYHKKHVNEASRLIGDFTSEMPKSDKIAFLYWLDKSLQWHAKSVALSSSEELNNQLELRFPLAYKKNINHAATYYEIPEAFIYAIIRQESAFREDVISAAGARGLMQVMPATAKLVARVSRIPYHHPDQLYSWEHNIRIGTAYLSGLDKHFGHHPVLMAAAYNAGPRQVNNWLRENPQQQMDIWIETLPWRETRNYLKNIVAFYTVYEYRMQKHPDLRTIMRGL